MKNKIIITGAGGLVGLTLLTLPEISKYQIIALDKNKTNLKLAKKINPNIKIFYCDLSEYGDWEKYFKDVEIVIQLQAQISDPKMEPYIKNNIDSVNNVLKACEKYKIKHLIHASSSVVIAISKDNYSDTKKIGEELVKKSKTPHTILRPPLMYGFFDINHIGFLKNIIDKSPIFPVPGKGDYLRQPLYAEDFAKIIINIIERKPKNQIYNVIGKEKITFVGLLKKVAKEKKRKILFLRIPIPIFLMMLKLYNLVSPKKPYVPSQLNALIAGDIFPVDNWEKEFAVRYTPFNKALKKIINSKYYEYRNLMIKSS